MVIEQILGNLKDIEKGNRNIDLLQIQWFEASKRIQRRKTKNGKDIAIRFLKEGQRLQQDDVLYIDDYSLISVDILPSDAIQVTPNTLLEMGSVCYEIGNKHLPMFIQNDTVLVPYEDPIFKWLNAMGYQPKKVHTKLINILNATVQPHSHSDGIGGSIFSKIMGLTGI